jgi:deoxyribodipyrimidine photo-lyase
MVKRERTPDATEDAKKRTRMPPKPATFNPIKVATVEAANAVDANPPFKQLMKGMENVIQNPEKGNCVVYWMRMTDLRRTFSLFSDLFFSHGTYVVSDNRALSKASEKAKEDGVPVAALFVISPQDFIAHDRGARKIDFTLRNLRVIKVLQTNPAFC